MSFDLSNTPMKFFGKYRGTVVDNKPPQDVAQPGRLQVQVAGLSEGGEGDEPVKAIEVWAMPCFHPGFCVLPQIGAKVWVEFVAGNITDPVWSGAWYPQYENGSVPIVEVDNESGSSRLLLKHSSGARIEITEDGDVVILDASAPPNFISMKSKAVVIGNGQNTAVIVMDENGIVVGKGNNFIHISDDGVVVSSEKNVRLQGQNVFLGGSEAGYESVLMGDAFGNNFDTHFHAHPMGPTGPPIPTTGPVTKSLLQLSSCVKVAKPG